MDTFGALFIIAEIGVNHNGKIDIAKRLVDCAVTAGADAAKFQSFSADRLVVRNAPKAAYQERNAPAAQDQYQMLKELELSERMHQELKNHCDQAGIEFLSTPFDEESSDLLEALNVKKFKISSGDLTNLPMLAHIARKKKPMIISTGMAVIEEIKEAVDTIQKNGAPDLAILHCVSNYPAAAEECNLLAMNAIASEFSMPVGWSDHTMGFTTAIAATALGARIIEKHITLDQNMTGPDHKASMEPDDFKKYVAYIREAKIAMGNGLKHPSASEIEVAKVARRSIAAKNDIKKGEVITIQSLVMLRPGTGMSSREIASIIGKTAATNIPAKTLLSKDMIA